MRELTKCMLGTGPNFIVCLRALSICQNRPAGLLPDQSVSLVHTFWDLTDWAETVWPVSSDKWKAPLERVK